MISERLREPHGSIEDETTGVTRPLFDPMRIEAADVIDALVAALEKAMLWTDEENDVGEWRQGAEAALDRAQKP